MQNFSRGEQSAGRNHQLEESAHDVLPRHAQVQSYIFEDLIVLQIKVRWKSFPCKLFACRVLDIDLANTVQPMRNGRFHHLLKTSHCIFLLSMFVRSDL